MDDGPPTSSYCLATGERLKPAETPGTYVTLDGRRTFQLRYADEPRRTLPKSSLSAASWAKRKAA